MRGLTAVPDDVIERILMDRPDSAARGRDLAACLPRHGVLDRASAMLGFLRQGCLDLVADDDAGTDAVAVAIAAVRPARAKRKPGVRS